MVDNVRTKNFILIRMLSYFVGSENLLKAIQQFLKLCENGDRGIEDLLTIVNKRMRLRNISVKAVLDSWASQPGLPMIKVIRDYKRGNLEVSQVN